MSYVLEYKFYFIYPREYCFICHWLIIFIIIIIILFLLYRKVLCYMFYFIGKCCVIICSGKYNFMCYWRILFHMILEIILFHMSLVLSLVVRNILCRMS